MFVNSVKPAPELDLIAVA